MTRVLIFGGRDWNNQGAMTEALNALHQTHAFTLVINGGQVSRDREQNRLYGADWQAAVWAQREGVPLIYFYANWSEGKKAGPLRNQRMLASGRPDLGVQFPGGSGTRDMRRRLDEAGVPVVDVCHVKSEENAS